MRHQVCCTDLFLGRKAAVAPYALAVSVEDEPSNRSGENRILVGGRLELRERRHSDCEECKQRRGPLKAQLVIHCNRKPVSKG